MSLRFELFENIIPREVDSTLTNNEAIGNVAIAKRCCVSEAVATLGASAQISFAAAVGDRPPYS